MLDREACERRVYRLATLLTGDPERAVRVIAAVVGAQPDLGSIDSAHLDRLTILRSREIRSGEWGKTGLAPEQAAAVRSLTRQQREAWVLNHVYKMQPREVARAMDCSVRAVQVHLTSAESAVERALPVDPASLGTALLHYSRTLDVPSFYRASRARRSSRRRVTRLLVALLLAAAAIGGAVALERSGLLDPILQPADSTGDRAAPREADDQ